MALNYISAAEAASLIKHGYNIGLSGFTPAGTAKAVTAELAKIAEAEQAKGNPFQIGIFTGASTGDSCDGVLSRVKAIRYRAPYTTNSDFRKAVNNGEIAYNDIHLSQMAQEVDVYKRQPMAFLLWAAFCSTIIWSARRQTVGAIPPAAVR